MADRRREAQAHGRAQVLESPLVGDVASARSASARCWWASVRGMVEEDLDELAALADSAGADPWRGSCRAAREPDPGTYVGKGKLDELHDVDPREPRRTR